MRAEISHRGIPKGAALGAPLVTFPAAGKSPGVGGAERPPLRGVQRGAAPRIGQQRARGESPSLQRGKGLPTPVIGNGGLEDVLQLPRQRSVIVVPGGAAGVAADGLVFVF